jgi:hypothetical protein
MHQIMFPQHKCISNQHLDSEVVATSAIRWSDSATVCIATEESPGKTNSANSILHQEVDVRSTTEPVEKAQGATNLLKR